MTSSCFATTGSTTADSSSSKYAMNRSCYRCFMIMSFSAISIVVLLLIQLHPILNEAAKKVVDTPGNSNDTNTNETIYVTKGQSQQEVTTTTTQFLTIADENDDDDDNDDDIDELFLPPIVDLTPEELSDEMLHDSIRWIHQECIEMDQEWSKTSNDQHERRTQSCVATKAALDAAVRAGATNIKVCTPKITLGSRNRRRGRQLNAKGQGGINMSNRTILLTCEIPNSTARCILDAVGTSRIFYGVNTTLSMSGFNFTNATGDMGSALYFLSNSMITVDDSSFLRNKATYGGAVMVSNSTLLFNNSKSNNATITFEANRGKHAGGIYVVGSNVSTMGNNSVRFERNRAVADGGAMYMSKKTTAKLQGVIMKSNSASGQGGAAVFSRSNVSMKTVEVSLNHAATGGGALVFHGATLRGNDISAVNNTATRAYGAMAFYNSTGTLGNSDIIRNSANTTGGIGVIKSDINIISTTFGANNSTNSNSTGGTVYVFRSKVDLRGNTQFKPNPGEINIVIADNGNPKYKGSFLSCTNKTVFCDDGQSNNDILERKGKNNRTNSNCLNKAAFVPCNAASSSPSPSPSITQTPSPSPTP